MSLHPRRGLLCFPRKNEYFHRENGAYFRENGAFSSKNGRFSCKNYFGVLRLSPVFTFGRPAGWSTTNNAGGAYLSGGWCQRSRARFGLCPLLFALCG